MKTNQKNSRDFPPYARVRYILPCDSADQPRSHSTGQVSPLRGEELVVVAGIRVCD